MASGSIARLRLRQNLFSLILLVLCTLLLLLVAEQGRTIQAQRYLIQQLFSDSVELTKMKIDKLNQERR